MYSVFNFNKINCYVLEILIISMRVEKNFLCRSINKIEDYIKIVSMNRNIIIIIDNTKRSIMRDLGYMIWSIEESIMDRNIGIIDIIIGIEIIV